ETQLQGLRRQARQATRYRNLSAAIYKTDALLFLLRWRACETDCVAAMDAASAAEASVASLTQTVETAAAAQNYRAALLPALRQQESACAAALQELVHQRAGLVIEETRAREDTERLKAQIAAAKQDLARERGHQQESLDQIARLERDERDLRAAGEVAAEALLKAVQTAKTAAVELVARDRNLQSCTAQIAEFNASRASYERTKVQSEAQVEQAEVQHAKAGENLRTAEAAAIGPVELAQAEALVETTKRRVAEARASADAAEARVTEAL